MSKVIKSINIIIIFCPNQDLKKPGFGTLQTCHQIAESLLFIGHSVSIQTCHTEYELMLVVKRKPDLVILAVKYLCTGGEEKILLADFFDSHRINYSGSTKKALSLDRSYLTTDDKERNIRDFTVAIIQQAHKELLVSAIEILTLKSSNTTQDINTSEALIKIHDFYLESKIKKFAIEQFKKIGARDYARIDLQINQIGELFLKTINLIPEMMPTSSHFPRACSLALELNYDQLIKLIMDQGIQRTKSSHKRSIYA